MRSLALILVSMTLAACAADPMGPDGPPPMADNGNDCAVIAAVAREHYRFNTTDNVAPPLWLDGEGRGWAPRCDWSRHGVSFPRTYDRTARPAPGARKTPPATCPEPKRAGSLGRPDHDLRSRLAHKN